MTTTQTAQINELLESEIKQADGFISLTRNDFKLMKGTVDSPFAAIITDSSDDIVSLATELQRSLGELNAEQIKGICVQIHSLGLKMKELSDFQKALSSATNNEIAIKMGIVQDNNLQNGLHKVVAFLF